MSRGAKQFSMVMALVAIIVSLAPASAQVANTGATIAIEEAQFVYRFRARDTLIQVCRRLLVQPQRWPEIQRRNGIRDPFNIPPDTPLRIPYSWLRLAPDSATVLAVAGTVTRDGVPVAPGDLLTQGMRIGTAPDGSVSIQFADRSVVTLQKSSVLRLERLQRVEGVSDGHSVELRLESGRAETAVQPKRDVGRFEIVTPVAISAVRGTLFRTGFDAAAGNATTETLEGTVGVAAAQDAASVEAGYGTRVEPTGAVLAPVPLLPKPDLTSLPAVNVQPVLELRFPSVPSAASYRAQLSADASFRALIRDEAAAIPSFDLPVPADGEFWVRARAVDERGIEGVDATQRFDQHLLPPAPELVSPATGTRFYTGDTTVEWSGLSEVQRYRLQLAHDALFTDLIDDREMQGGLSAALHGLAAGTYYWRVAGVNSRDELGAWSEPRSLIRRAPTPVVEAARVDRRELRLNWAVQAGEQYRLQMSRDASFKQPFIDTTLSAGEFVLAKPRGGPNYVRLQVLPVNADADPFGEACRFEVPISAWLKVLLGSAVLLPAVL